MISEQYSIYSYTVYLWAEPTHDRGVLDVHLLEHLLGELPVALELVGEAVVVQLPRVGRQVEGVVLRALS